MCLVLDEEDVLPLRQLVYKVGKVGIAAQCRTVLSPPPPCRACSPPASSSTTTLLPGSEHTLRVSMIVPHICLCVIQPCHCSSSAEHSAPTAASSSKAGYYAYVEDPRCIRSTTEVLVVCQRRRFCPSTFRNVFGIFPSVSIIPDIMFVDSSIYYFVRKGSFFWNSSRFSIGRGSFLVLPAAGPIVVWAEARSPCIYTKQMYRDIRQPG